MNDAYLRFDYPNVGYVLDGVEDATVRYDFERDFNLGQIISLKTPGGNIFGHAEVKNLVGIPVNEAVREMDADGRHHPAEDTADLMDRLAEHYPEAGIGPDDYVTIVYFDVYQSSGGEA